MTSRLPDFDDALIWKLVTCCHMSAEEAEAAYAKLEREGKLEEARRLILKHERREAERNRSERVHVPIITHHLHWAPILALLYIVVAAAANRLFPAKALPTARWGRVRNIGRFFGAGGANLKRQGPADPVFDRPPIWAIAHLRRVGDGDSGVTKGGDENGPAF